MKQLILGAAAAEIVVAAGVALVARGLWNVAKYPDLDPKPKNEKKNKKKMVMMKAPSRPHYMPRDEFRRFLRITFWNLRSQ